MLSPFRKHMCCVCYENNYIVLVLWRDMVESSVPVLDKVLWGVPSSQCFRDRGDDACGAKVKRSTHITSIFADHTGKKSSTGSLGIMVYTWLVVFAPTTHELTTPVLVNNSCISRWDVLIVTHIPVGKIKRAQIKLHVSNISAWRLRSVTCTSIHTIYVELWLSSTLFVFNYLLLCTNQYPIGGPNIHEACAMVKCDSVWNLMIEQHLE